MQNGLWKRAKLRLLKLIGQNNADRLSLLQRQLTALALRTGRNLRQRDRSDRATRVTRYSANRQTFFGYYDVSPFSDDNKRLLAMSGPIGNRPPRSNEFLEVGYFDYEVSDEFHRVDETNTWCWQQGCRLRWDPAAPNTQIMYNKLVGGHYGAVIQNIQSREVVREFDFPIYDIDGLGRHALTLNFSRLGRLRPGYGYINLPDETADSIAPPNDGVWVADLQDGRKELLFSLHDLATTDPESTMRNGSHYLNHISISPDGERFICFHLWESGEIHRNRLVIGRLDGSDIKLVPTDGAYSHYTWTSPTELLLTVFYDRNRSDYIRYDLKSDEVTPMHDALLCVDGHPTWSPDGKTLLTDTYPDKYGEQALINYTEQDGGYVLHRFRTPIHLSYRHGGEVRCDLHPRWDRTGRRICVDSASGGSRSLYVVEIGNDDSGANRNV